MSAFNNLRESDYGELEFAVATRDREGIKVVLGRIFWRAIAPFWNDEIRRILFWTFRVRDLRWLFEKLFGPAPTDILLLQ